ncbi:hypothetical protein AAFN86_29090 [Roseomonas sp. CAU 1739]
MMLILGRTMGRIRSIVRMLDRRVDWPDSMSRQISLTMLVVPR